MSAPITHEVFLERIVTDGIAAAEKDYASSPDKKNGAVAGFMACRGKDIPGLAQLLTTARDSVQAAHRQRAKDYWWFRCYEAEVEWVCNVISAACYNQGLPVLVIPTARGMIKAAEILGVASPYGE